MFQRLIRRTVPLLQKVNSQRLLDPFWRTFRVSHARRTVNDLRQALKELLLASDNEQIPGVYPTIAV